MLIGYAIITCCHAGCGITFAVPDRWNKCRHDDHEWFYCPNGHRQHYSGDSEEDKLRRERDRLAQRIAERDDEIARQREARQATERQLSATRGVVTRIKNRVGHGVCPCCNRTFGNLQTHMHKQHPDYPKSDAAAVAAE